jgi:hypothetical protein
MVAPSWPFPWCGLAGPLMAVRVVERSAIEFCTGTLGRAYLTAFCHHAQIEKRMEGR